MCCAVSLFKTLEHLRCQAGSLLVLRHRLGIARANCQPFPTGAVGQVSVSLCGPTPGQGRTGVMPPGRYPYQLAALVLDMPTVRTTVSAVTNYTRLLQLSQAFTK